MKWSRYFEALESKTLILTNELVGLLDTALDVISTCIESADSPENASFTGFDALQAALKKITGLPFNAAPNSRRCTPELSRQ